MRNNMPVRNLQGPLVSGLLAWSLIVSVQPVTSQSGRPDVPGRAEKQGGSTLPAQTGQQDAQSIYLKAWNLINETYFDRTFNKQDWAQWKHKYDGKLKSTEDARSAIKSMLDSLNNQHTKLIESGSAKKSDPNLFGIGLKLRKKSDKDPTVIVEATPGSPAQKVGVRPFDVLVAIDGKSVVGKSLDETADMLRGPEHTKTTVTVLRKGASKKITAERGATPEADLLCVRTLPGGIGYIRLDDMHSMYFMNVFRDEFQKIATAPGVILDLRDNGGGLLVNAIELSMLFVQQGKYIMSVVDNAGYKTVQVQKKPPVYKGRVFVLINRETAAAAEIIAAALQESADAQVVGEPSNGSSTIDAINRLGDGVGITISIAEWTTPKGKSILNKGIKPDGLVVVPDKDLASNGPWWLTDELNEPGTPKCADTQLLKALSLAQAATKQ